MYLSTESTHCSDMECIGIALICANDERNVLFISFSPFWHVTYKERVANVVCKTKIDIFCNLLVS